MKNIFFFFLLSFPLQGAIKEVMEYQSFAEHAQPKTLLITDIDNTLIAPAQELGSDPWFRKRLTHYKNNGYGEQEALEKALVEWEGVQNITTVQLVEKTIPQILHSLQEKKFIIIGLTTRSLNLANRTIQQLQSVDIDLNLTAPSRDDIFLTTPHPILFRKGILFTSGSHKGVSLRKLLETLNYFPEKIVFINDKGSHLKPLEEECEKLGIEFIGLRYGYHDEKVKNFRPEIADVQFEKFSNILSDQEAENIILSRNALPTSLP